VVLYRYKFYGILPPGRLGMLPHRPTDPGAEPQNLMPVGDSLANGCLFSGKKLLQRGGLPLPTPHSGSRQNASALNQRKFIHPPARAGKNKTGGTIYGNEIQKSGCSLPRDSDLLLDFLCIGCGKRYC
jgi:hypothetical protein